MGLISKPEHGMMNDQGQLICRPKEDEVNRSNA